MTLFAILNSVFFIVFLPAALRVTGTYPDSYVHSYVLADRALSFVFRKYLRLVSTHVAYETISNKASIDS